jgi:cytochrome c-type biogenesis protein CcmF
LLPADVALFVCAFVLATTTQEFVWGARVRMRAGQNPVSALINLTRSNRRRYGGYVVHVGMVLIAIAVVGSQFYQIQVNAWLQPGQSLQAGAYTLSMGHLQEGAFPGYRKIWAELVVRHDNQLVGTIAPAKEFHANFETEPDSKIALLSSPLDDLYVVLAGWQPDGSASFFVFVNPLVSWLWVGGVILLLGGLITLWPEGEPARALVTEPGRGRVRAEAT